MSTNNAPVFVLDFRRGVVEAVKPDHADTSAQDVPPAPPGVTFAALGTPPRADEPSAGS